MVEARRFLRYVVPGIIFIIEVIATFLLMDYVLFKSVFELAKNVGSILGIFVVSGGLGYLFSNIYFWVYWSLPFTNSIVVNHVKVIEQLRKEYLEIIDINTNKELEHIDKPKSWVIMNTFWHTRLKRSKRIEGINDKNNQLSDITHGLGAMIIATLSAGITCIFFYSAGIMQSNPNNLMWLILFWGLLIFPMPIQYLRTHKVFQSLINSTFANEVIMEYGELNKKIKILYSK